MDGGDVVAWVGSVAVVDVLLGYGNEGLLFVREEPVVKHGLRAVTDAVEEVDEETWKRGETIHEIKDVRANLEMGWDNAL